MGSEGNYGGGNLSFSYVPASYPTIGGFPTSNVTEDPPKPYPLRTAELLRVTPPRWVTEAAWSVLAASTDAVIRFAARLDVTYDEHIEPVLSEWRSRKGEAECESCGMGQDYSDCCVSCESPWVHRRESAGGASASTGPGPEERW